MTSGPEEGARRTLPRRGFLRRLALAGCTLGLPTDRSATLSGSAGIVEGSDPPSRARHLSGRDVVVPGEGTIDPIGVQLYTLRTLMASDVPGTLEAVAALGYREVEFAGLQGLTPEGMKEMLDRIGLRAASSHHSVQDIRGGWDRMLDGAAALGQSHVVCASIPGSARTLDGYRGVADEFNAAGEAARARGLQFGYHNHDFEFAAIDGIVPYDLLLERCEPELVAMQMDVFWVVNGGADPLAYFSAHPGRFHSIHAKDRTADGGMVAVGEGVIDFAAILAQSGPAGIRNVFVEHDRPADPLASIRSSFDHLSQL